MGRQAPREGEGKLVGMEDHCLDRLQELHCDGFVACSCCGEGKGSECLFDFCSLSEHARRERHRLPQGAWFCQTVCVHWPPDWCHHSSDSAFVPVVRSKGEVAENQGVISEWGRDWGTGSIICAHRVASPATGCTASSMCAAL